MEALSNEKRYKAIEEAYETSVAANQPDQQEADISAQKYIEMMSQLAQKFNEAQAQLKEKDEQLKEAQAQL